VETRFFAALRSTCLVSHDASWAACEYSRCGRTDRGVSALRQLVVLRVRCAPEGSPELDFVGALNRALPADIRVLSWRPAPEGFSARFKCALPPPRVRFGPLSTLLRLRSASWRQYKYFFWDDGELDLDAMRQAASLFVGTHDFRNACKMDVAAAHSFVRHIHSFTIQPEPAAGESCAGDAPADCPPPERRRLAGSQARLWSLNVRGTAFLWHQVRCMAALLLLVGRRLEQPSVVSALLDVQATQGKPAYDMAPEEPLLFFGCGYETPRSPGAPLLPAELGHTPERTLQLLRGHLQAQARCAAVRARVFHLALRHCEARMGEGAGEARGGPRHVPLMARKREASLEQMLEKRGLAARGAAVETGRALSGLAARGGVKTSKLEDAVERLAASG